jgi:hypothetical protein
MVRLLDAHHRALTVLANQIHRDVHDQVLRRVRRVHQVHRERRRVHQDAFVKRAYFQDWGVEPRQLHRGEPLQDDQWWGNQMGCFPGAVPGVPCRCCPRKGYFPDAVPQAWVLDVRLDVVQTSD